MVEGMGGGPEGRGVVDGLDTDHYRRADWDGYGAGRRFWGWGGGGGGGEEEGVDDDDDDGGGGGGGEGCSGTSITHPSLTTVLVTVGTTEYSLSASFSIAVVPTSLSRISDRGGMEEGEAQ